ncbi:gluconokinase [Aeromicrobium sp.]|uniref:gluconokinase n=1 Tax=Aeromicrobium sp. TaxID=1871063 RepID=UPI003D6B920A
MSAARQVVVMGVTATGKSEVGTRLATRLDMTYIEGDEFHPDANIEKMSAGEPLTDDDRRPWLETLAQMLADNRGAGVATVLGCSALRRSYRDILRGPASAGTVEFVHLTATFDVLRHRMEQREHFMPTSLLQSQFDTLEPLETDERGVVLDVDAPLEDVVDAAVAAVESLRG